jgi:hypothetical protein
MNGPQLQLLLWCRIHPQNDRWLRVSALRAGRFLSKGAAFALVARGLSDVSKLRLADEDRGNELQRR